MTILTYAVKQKIEQLIEIGEKDKTKIYERIIEDFGIPQDQVKKIARELKKEWQNKITILNNEDDQ